MKKILISLATIAAVGAIVVGATTAYFSDTETNAGNVIQAGTIDISADGDTWSQGVRFEDMKPSYVKFIEFDVTNSGNNPVRVYKHIAKVTTDENGTNDPELEWYNAHNGQVKNDIDTVIEYDMYIGGQIVWDDKAKTTGHVESGDVVIDEDDGITLADVASHYIYIGELEPGDKKHIIQSYHMATNTENWAQSDTVSFDIELLGL